MLAGIAWMAYDLARPATTAGVEVLDASEQSPRHRRDKRSKGVSAEQLPLAGIPWAPDRDPARPQPKLIAYATAPWVADRAQGISVTLETARVPAIPLRHDPKHPTPVDIKDAQVPWRVVAGHEPAEVELAQIPKLKPRFDPRRPAPVDLPTADVPWSKDPARPAPAEVPTAKVPFKAPKPQP